MIPYRAERGALLLFISHAVLHLIDVPSFVWSALIGTEVSVQSFAAMRFFEYVISCECERKRAREGTQGHREWEMGEWVCSWGQRVVSI